LVAQNIHFKIKKNKNRRHQKENNDKKINIAI